MATLLILNQQPYDGTDVTWNALRLARQLHSDGVEVRIFLMNDSVDLARDGITPPEGVEDMVAMTKDLIAKGVPVKSVELASKDVESSKAKATMMELSTLLWQSALIGCKVATKS